MQPKDVPVLETELDMPPFDFQQHNWQQFGYELICDSCPSVSRHCSPIPSGKMLVGTPGNWEIVKEGGLMRPATG